MKNFARPFAIAALGVATIALDLGTASQPVLAQSYFEANEIRANTPSCRANPSAPVKGYVVGMRGSRPTRTYSFVGCFNSMAACERWRGPTSGFITRRIIQNRCEQR